MCFSDHETMLGSVEFIGVLLQWVAQNAMERKFNGIMPTVAELVKLYYTRNKSSTNTKEQKKKMKLVSNLLCHMMLHQEVVDQYYKNVELFVEYYLSTGRTIVLVELDEQLSCRLQARFEKMCTVVSSATASVVNTRDGPGDDTRKCNGISMIVSNLNGVPGSFAHSYVTPTQIKTRHSVYLVVDVKGVRIAISAYHAFHQEKTGQMVNIPLDKGLFSVADVMVLIGDFNTDPRKLVNWGFEIHHANKSTVTIGHDTQCNNSGGATTMPNIDYMLVAGPEEMLRACDFMIAVAK